MPYQFIREHLREEADKLCQVCETVQEKMIIWILLHTGLRVSELCDLTSQHILWQQKSLRITGKGGIHGKKTKKRVQSLLEHYFEYTISFLLGLDKYRK